MLAHATLNRLYSSVSENDLVKKLLHLARAVRHRWRAFCFVRRFYTQARSMEPAAVESTGTPPLEDFSERLFSHAVPARVHNLLRLRVASQIASISQTQHRAGLCRAEGWSSEQIGAALLGVTSECFSRREKLLLAYAEDITRTPIDVDPQVVRELRAHFTEPELLELTVSIAHENLRARLIEASARLQVNREQAGVAR